MIKSSIVNVPEESWDPLTFLSQKNREHLINEKKRESKKVDVKLEEMSLDSDVSNPKQHIYIKTDCVNEASGSSYIELGNTKILCSVYGPREIPRKDDYDFKVANVNCEFRFNI
jgi:exosome complex component MTR3